MQPSKKSTNVIDIILATAACIAGSIPLIYYFML